MVTTSTRNATLADFATLLTQQQARKVDIVASASNLRAEGGRIIVKDADKVIDESGVSDTDGRYDVTEIFDEGLSQRLEIPRAYLRRLRNEHIDLYDENVNGWLTKSDKSFTIRTFRSDDEGGVGIARAFLSDRYARLDNLDALTATLDGIRQAGVQVDASNLVCDLTERRMSVRVTCPEIKGYATELLKGYRSPFSGNTGDENPTVFAGFVANNSETGNGAWTITPRLVIEICNNGATITKDVLRAVHLGSQQSEGVIDWSADTQRKSLDLVTARTRDAVATYLNVDYVTKAIRSLTEAAGKPVDTVDEVKVLTKGLSFSEEQTNDVLAHFIRGGQMTIGGVSQAITAYAQEVDDPDTAYDLENAASRLLGV